MCISHFRDICKASDFRYTDREKALSNPDLIVRDGTNHYNGRNYYYVTDKNKLKKLAKDGNVYAIETLRNIKHES